MPTDRQRGLVHLMRVEVAEWALALVTQEQVDHCCNTQANKLTERYH